MKVYISGAMASRPNEYYEAFKKAEEELKKYGHTVINPAVLPKGLNHTRYMPICLAMVDASDIVFMMKGWGDSKGARLEHDYAIYQEKIILYEERSENGVSNQIFTD